MIAKRSYVRDPSQRDLLPVLLPLLLGGPGEEVDGRDGGRPRQRVVRVGVEVRRERRDEPLAVREARLQLQVLRRRPGQLQV